MDRLTGLIVLFTASVCSSVCGGQEASPYTIAGDVRAPGNYFFSASQQVDLAVLLHRAHPLSESGNAVILRGQPLAVVTSINVQPNRQARPTGLQPGDIVMFRRFAGGPTGDGSAIVAHGGIPTVVSLPGGPLPLFEALESLQIQTSQPVSLVRAEWGELQISLLNQNELVKHGDVLDLTLPGDGQQFTQTPMISESTDGFRHVLNNANLPRSVSQRDHEGNGKSAIEMTDPSDEFQGSTANSGMPSLIVPGLNFDEPRGDDAVEVEEATNFVSSTLTLPESTASTGSEIRGNGQVSADAEAAFRNASLQRTAELPGTPAAQDGASKATAETASNAVWNGIFVVGLLMAISLIVAGWMKTAQERRMEDQDDAVAPARSYSVQNSEPAISLTPAKDHTPAASFWQSDMFSEPITVYSQDVDANHDIQPQEQASEHSVFAETEIEASEIAEILSAQDSQTTNAIVHESESTHRAKTATPELPDSENLPKSVTQIAEIAAETPAATAVDPLDDLIHNRLPLELNQTQLPLQIAMYGRPDGPRRLRIDAAHTQIAAPHLATIERRSQLREPVMTTQQKSPRASQHSGRAQPQAHYPADSPASKASPAAKPPAEDVSRFDRALNFLEEQSER